MLDIREKLVGLLCKMISPTITIGEQADFLIANGVTIQQWISVEERLPEAETKQKWGYHTFEKSYRLLLVCKQKSGRRMVKEGYCEFWGDEHTPIWKVPGTIDSVTHWMPLPEPPKGEDERRR